jgi:peptidoglycan-associated lipoprotein
MLAVFLVLGAGCAKKKVAGEPVEQEKQVTQEKMAPEKEGMKEEGLSEAERKARAEARKAAQEAKEVLVTEKIYFDFDKYDLKPRSKDVLRDKAGIMKKYPTWNLLIEGHCDERGTEEYNLALGERRARAAYEYLVILGVDSGRMKIVSFGEEKPAVMGHNEEAWAKNRRCEFRVFD